MTEETRRKAIEAMGGESAAIARVDALYDLMREIAREEAQDVADSEAMRIYLAERHSEVSDGVMFANPPKSAAPTPATGEWDTGKGRLNTQAAPDNSSLREALDDAYLSASARDRPTCAKGPHQTHHVTKGQYNAQHEQRSTGDGDVLRGSEQPGRTITAMVGAVASVARTVAGESGGTEASIRFVRGVPPISRDSHGVTDVVDRGSNLDSAAVYHGANGPPETTQEWPGPPGYYPEHVWLSGQTAYSDAPSSGTARPKYIRADVAAKEVAEAAEAVEQRSDIILEACRVLGAQGRESLPDAARRVVAERDAARQEVSAVDMLRESAISDRERERERADRAEARVKELEQLAADHQSAWMARAKKAEADRDELARQVAEVAIAGNALAEALRALEAK